MKADKSTPLLRWAVRWTAVLGALVAIPLLAFPFGADERFAFYTDTARVGANPIRIVSSAIREIPFYIGRGNFRPLGRMLDYAEHSFSFELASISGVPLPVVHGLFRVGIIVVAGLAGLASLHLLSRSAEAGGRDRLHNALLGAVWSYPIVFAASVVAAGSGSPFTLFPFLYIGSTALAMWAAIAVVRDANLMPGALTIPAVVGYVMLGAVLASTFDLVYLAAPLIAALAVVRVSLARIGWRDVLSLRLTRAVLGTAAGFVAVFLPTRLLIQRACSGGACYAASDLSFDPSALHVLGDRMLSGFPGSGWAVVDRWSGTADPGWSVFLKNAGATLVAVVGLGLVFAAFRFLRARNARFFAETSSTSGGSDRLLWPLALVLGWPAAVVFVGSLVAALSAQMQAGQPAIGSGWRDSVFGALGWAIALSVIVGTLIARLSRRPRHEPVVLIACLILVLPAAGKTFLVNANLASAASRNPEAVINNRLAAEVIDFDQSELGNDRRCELLADFSAVYRDRALERDKQLTNALNRVSRQRYGRAFCDPGSSG